MNKVVSKKSEFTSRVCHLVSQIPRGRLMTYGQIAALCGSPRAARIVGGIAHFGPTDIPWHRVVNKSGGLASGYHGGRRSQETHLVSEGVEVKDQKVINLKDLIWQPNQIH